MGLPCVVGAGGQASMGANPGHHYELNWQETVWAGLLPGWWKWQESHSLLRRSCCLLLLCWQCPDPKLGDELGGEMTFLDWKDLLFPQEMPLEAHGRGLWCADRFLVVPVQLASRDFGLGGCMRAWEMCVCVCVYV